MSTNFCPALILQNPSDLMESLHVYLILKEAANKLTPVLTYLFNKSLSTDGDVPDDWRLATFPLHKKGPKDSAENYRPISLTAVIRP